MHHDDRSKQHDAQNRELFAIRRTARRLAAEERELERTLRAFGDHIERVEACIEAEMRKEHWGHEPPRPLAWPDRRHSDLHVAGPRVVVSRRRSSRVVGELT